MSEERIPNYQQFWPFYLSQHSKPGTRLFHFIGTSLGLLCLIPAIQFKQWAFIPIGLIIGYAFAWVGHFFIENNRPATFKYPYWSFISDWRMWFLMLTGKIGAELKKYRLN